MGCHGGTVVRMVREGQKLVPLCTLILRERGVYVGARRLGRAGRPRGRLKSSFLTHTRAGRGFEKNPRKQKRS